MTYLRETIFAACAEAQEKAERTGEPYTIVEIVDAATKAATAWIEGKNERLTVVDFDDMLMTTETGKILIKDARRDQLYACMQGQQSKINDLCMQVHSLIDELEACRQGYVKDEYGNKLARPDD